jgi:hypothetical protein
MHFCQSYVKLYSSLAFEYACRHVETSRSGWQKRYRMDKFQPVYPINRTYADVHVFCLYIIASAMELALHPVIWISSCLLGDDLSHLQFFIDANCSFFAIHRYLVIFQMGN